jgi:hypothetical protein
MDTVGMHAEDPRPLQWGRIAAPVDQRPSVLRVRADYGGRHFTAKLRVVVHYLLHQLLNHLLADDAILLARQFCDCLRDRAITSSASLVSTLSDPAVAGYSAKKSSITSTIMQ